MTLFVPDARPTFILLSNDDEPAPPWLGFLDAPGNDSLCIELKSRNAGAQNRWAARLDQTVRGATTPVLLVASGASCLAAAWWARLSPSFYVAPVAGAIFLDPSDPYGAESRGRGAPFEGPPTLLPFPSAIVALRADEARALLAARLARSWGSELHDAAAALPETQPGGGPWRARERLVRAALREMLEHQPAADGALAPVAPTAVGLRAV